MTCLLFLCPDVDLYSGDETTNIYLIFATFTSKLTSIIASVKVYMFLFIVSMSSSSRFASSA
jgi:hypothetical protein